MKLIVMAAAAAFALPGCTFSKPSAENKEQAASVRPSDAESEAYMRKAEEDWAQSFVTDQSEMLKRILSDDFSGYFSNGSLHNKAETIATETPDPAMKSARLDKVSYRHYGDTVVAQGVESGQRKDGGPDLRLAWTDIWVFREGKWQVVASHVSKLPENQ